MRALQPSPPAPDDHRYSVVTVVYEGDLLLLHLQARSLALHAAPGLFAEVVVIDNTRRGLAGRGVRRLLREYGPLAPLVRVVRPDALTALPRMSGWWSQQVLKLAVVATITTDRYLVLDAKNVLVGTLDRDFLQAPDGRARLYPASYASHPHRPSLETTLRYLGLDPARHLDFGSTVTPFVMDTAVVGDLVATIERRSGRSLAQEMGERGLTEFFLYQGWLVAGGGALEEVHAMERVRCPTVWPSRTGADAVRAEINQARAGRAPVFTVHQRAVGRLDAGALAALVGFWVERGLFADEASARAFLRRFRLAWHRTAPRRLTGVASRAGRPGGRLIGAVRARPRVIDLTDHHPSRRASSRT